MTMIETAYTSGKFYSTTSSSGTVTLDPLYVKQYITSYTTPYYSDAVWRIVLLLGCVPSALLFYKVVFMPESARYTALVKGDAAQALKDLEKEAHVKLTDGSAYTDVKVNNSSSAPRKMPAGQFFRKYGVWLLGTSLSWFLLDIAFYSLGFYQGLVYTAVGFVPAAGTLSAIHSTYL